MNQAAAYEVLMPKLSDQMTEATIARWLVEDGQWVARGDEIAEVETDKAVVGLEADRDGTVRIVAGAGASIALGARIAYIGPADFQPPSVEEPAGVEVAAAPTPTTTSPNSTERATPTDDVVPGAGTRRANRPFASPLVRKLAAQHNLALHGVSGTGPRGRIIKRDLMALIDGSARSSVAGTDGTAPAPTDTVLPMTRRQRIVAERMQAAKQFVPEFTATIGIDVTSVTEMRKRLALVLDDVPSYNAFFVRAIALAARSHPKVNARVEDNALVVYGAVNVGVAVSSGDDLLVPVVRNADALSLKQIHAESRRLADGVRTNSIGVDDLAGGTITVSNLGMFGTTSFQAILNANQTMIVAIGAVIPSVVVHEGEIAVRDMVQLTVTADHRAVYGADAARFLETVSQLLREPLQLTL